MWDKIDLLFIMLILGTAIAQGLNFMSIPAGFIWFILGVLLYYIFKTIFLYLDKK